MNYSQASLSLESPTFSIQGVPSGDCERWYEFSVQLHNSPPLLVGGAIATKFADQLATCLSKSCGTPLSEMSNQRHASEINDPLAEYVGYVVFSGYNTLYFFRKSGGSFHVVLANNVGQLLAHSTVGEDIPQTWLPILHKILQDEH